MAKAIVKAVPELGFRRAGMFFSRDGREVDVDDKTLAILKAERSLLVVELPADAVADTSDAPRGKSKRGE